MSEDTFAISASKLSALSAGLASGKPVSTPTRGISVAATSLSPYSSDPEKWPIDDLGKVQPQVCWGGLPYPLARSNLHFLIAGVPGSGKTLSIRLLLQSVFASTMRGKLPGSDRAVVYDPKLEFYPVFLGMGVEPERVHILNPFDARCCPWNLAADYSSPAEAHQLAQTIIPVDQNHSQPFFPKSAGAVLAAVISIHMRLVPGRWDLADILIWSQCAESIQALYLQDPSNPLVLMTRNLLVDGTTRSNILAELSSHLFAFLPIAACWRRAQQEGRKGISVRDFLKSRDDVVLLGANQTHSAALATINRLFLKRLAEHTLDHTADGQWEAMNRTWLVLDETRELGKVPGLADFINKGRSRGVCAVLGFQDYAGLKEAFGENVAHELTATCAHKLFLRLGSESAEWASRSIGKSEVRETTLNRGTSAGVSLGDGESQTAGKNYGPDTSSSYSITKSRNIGFNFNSSTQTSTVVREKDAVMSSEIAHLPGFDEGGGLHGFLCRSSKDGLPTVHKLNVSAEYFHKGLADPSKDLGYLPRPQTEQDLIAVISTI